MKNRILSILSAALIAASLFTASSCSKEPADPSSDYSYISQQDLTNEPEFSSEDESGAADSFTVDTSWQKNYSAEYKYFDSSSSEESVTILEMKGETSFCASYPDSGNLVYYKESDGDIDCYTVVPSEKEYVHSVLKNTGIDSISSTLMKLTGVSEELPKLTNVLYMNDEEVAGRNAKKYIQRAYTDGEVTETVYIWMDGEFGFALKCEDFDADDKLKTYWEITKLSVGNVSDEDIGPDVSSYDFTEGDAG
ncbi:MAG: hypothetical protein IJS90_08665 [Clostridia bacterium]|nr:hypothetical protein [Clostridia bacterium]